MYKPIPSHEKLFAEGKSGPHASFSPVFLALGWPWVGEFVGFIISVSISILYTASMMPTTI